MEKAVVVGGSGFLGSHVADHLTNAGFQVTIYDKIKSQWLRQDQEMVLGDVDDGEKINQTIAGAEVVYNFAALADLNEALKQPIKTVKVNILGNLNVMEACCAHGVKRFIYASTVYVHSKEGGFYRCSKLTSEAYVEEYQRVYGLNYTILRYGSLYGARANDSNGIKRIVKSAVNDGVIRYAGNINSMREYIHVDDAAKASLDILSDQFENENIVLTGQEPMKVIEMLKMLAEILSIDENNIEFIENNNEGHYVRTPYSYQPKLGKKYIPPVHVDLGQGLLQLINEISNRNNL
jgi:UDP-glucose 4-epimerase